MSTDSNTPTVESHARLEPFVGTFRAEAKLWMGSGEPMVSTGTMVNAWDLGGRFLKQTYTGDTTEGPFQGFEGRGFWGFNTVTNEYEGFWIDTASTRMQHEVGSVDASGRVWTMLGSVRTAEGKTMTKRSVITLHDDDHHTMEMYFGADGEAPKAMEITYARS